MSHHYQQKLLILLVASASMKVVISADCTEIKAKLKILLWIKSNDIVYYIVASYTGLDFLKICDCHSQYMCNGNGHCTFIVMTPNSADAYGCMCSGGGGGGGGNCYQSACIIVPI